jgi:hypothetical protein
MAVEIQLQRRDNQAPGELNGPANDTMIGKGHKGAIIGSLKQPARRDWYK